MVEAPPRPISLISNYQQIRPLLAAYGPPELQILRESSLQRFMQVGLPTHKTEEFKYTPLHELSELDFKPAYGANIFRSDLERTPAASIEALTMAFVNGEYAPELSTEGKLPEGVILCDLRSAFEDYPELVMQHLGKVHTLDDKLGSSNDERFRWLNTAYLSEGVFLHFSRGVVDKNPIQLLFINRADGEPFAAHPRVLIHLSEGAEAKVIESHVGLGGRYFSNAVTEIVQERGSILEHDRIQYEAPDAMHVGLVAVQQEAESVLTSNNTQFGAKTGRVDVNVWVGGERAETWLNGAYVASGDQLLDNHTRIDHAVPNCNSFEVYKGILSDRAVGVFNGKIFVYQDAQKTDAKQTNQAILLSPTAQVNTKPQLEIFADDVKCTHGATVGQLREDARFYLRSRGIPAKQAEALLVYAFAAEVLEKISVQSVRDTLERLLTEKLHSEQGHAAEGA